MSTNEEWLPIPGWEGYYEASDQGRVRSLQRTVIRKNGSPCTVRARILKHSWTISGGYGDLNLTRNGKRQRSTLHVLVLQAFVGPRPEGHFGRHLNGDPTDNRLSNLAWGTPSQNQYDTVAHGTHFWAKRTHCGRGHEYNGDNVSMSGNARRCRACITERSQNKRRAARAAV